MMSTFSSLVALEVVVTTSDATCDAKVGIMANRGTVWIYINTESENVKAMALSSLWMLKAVAVAAGNDRVVAWQPFFLRVSCHSEGGFMEDLNIGHLIGMLIELAIPHKAHMPVTYHEVVAGKLKLPSISQ